MTNKQNLTIKRDVSQSFHLRCSKIKDYKPTLIKSLSYIYFKGKVGLLIWDTVSLDTSKLYSSQCKYAHSIKKISRDYLINLLMKIFFLFFLD